MSARDPYSRITAVLGPTNTGKTHLAIERMLGHQTGMIGFPLRLLARENYDRVAAIKGRAAVALITGEEKIVPAGARYFICTVEAMPLERRVDFLAIDEIQLCGDPDRGHVFTDRLLRARGERETMFLGAETIRPLIRKLVPDADQITRPRLSQLTYAGARKITRLPRRSAVVAFSAADVYSLAELVRRQRGGAAVVLGALSPRTRNAQVEMYQAGEVDYLIATDAIGMGLNMNVEHVSFAERSKFDGRIPRRLTAAELAQIAGRAGRHMNDGTFGVTGDCPEFDPEIVEAIENHSFDAIRRLYWRNTDLLYTTVRDLKRSLDMPPPHGFLSRQRQAVDHRSLEALARMPDILDRAKGPGRVRLLWEICQIPDFAKTLNEEHARLLAQVYSHLTDPAERLPTDWVAKQMRRFDRADGDIDTLVGRISHVRTWTYITHRSDWIDDPMHWQQTARAIEDRLSDALHDRLTQRFVDRRAAHLSRRLREVSELMAGVTDSGDVIVEGHPVGRLTGFVFRPDGLEGGNAKPVLTAARRVLPQELTRRAEALHAAPDAAFAVSQDARVSWRGSDVAILQAGAHPMAPEFRLLCSDLLDAARRDLLRTRLQLWMKAHLVATTPALPKLLAAELTGAARGVAYQLVEGMGCVSSDAVASLVRNLDEAGRKALGRMGVRFGTESVYLPGLLKPKAVLTRAVLWSVYHQSFPESGAPPAGRVTIPRDAGTPDGFYRAVGYVRLGEWVLRVDIAERLAALARAASRKGVFVVNDEMLSLAAAAKEAMAGILGDLGYRRAGESEGVTQFLRRRSRPMAPKSVNKSKNKKAEQAGANPATGPKKPRNKKRPALQGNAARDEVRMLADSPFAVLKRLRVGK